MHSIEQQYQARLVLGLASKSTSAVSYARREPGCPNNHRRVRGRIGDLIEHAHVEPFSRSRSTSWTRGPLVDHGLSLKALRVSKTRDQATVVSNG
jgi:hypothetical protein